MLCYVLRITYITLCALSFFQKPDKRAFLLKEVFKGLKEIRLHVFFYKHGVFQSEARICLSFSQIEPQNMLKICLT